MGCPKHLSVMAHRLGRWLSLTKSVSRRKSSRCVPRLRPLESASSYRQSRSRERRPCPLSQPSAHAPRPQGRLGTAEPDCPRNNLPWLVPRGPSIFASRAPQKQRHPRHDRVRCYKKLNSKLTAASSSASRSRTICTGSSDGIPAVTSTPEARYSSGRKVRPTMTPPFTLKSVKRIRG